MNPIKLAVSYIRRQRKLMKNADNYNCHPDVPAKENRVNVFRAFLKIHKILCIKQ